MEFYFSPFHTKKTSTFSMLKLKALWSRSYWFTCALYHSTRYWISSLADLLHDIKFIHFNSAASLFTNIYLFICDLNYLKKRMGTLNFFEVFSCQYALICHCKYFFFRYLSNLSLHRNPSIISVFLSSFIMSLVVHRFRHVEFWILVVFYRRVQLKKSKKYSKFDTSKSIFEYRIFCLRDIKV